VEYLREREVKQALGANTKWAAFRIVAVYSVFGGFWIYFSDTAMGNLIHDPVLITRLSVFKGLSFILVTASLLYILITRHARHMSETARQLRESESLLKLTAYSVEHITDAVYWLTDKGQFWNCNAAACNMLGYSREELLKMSVLDIDPGYKQENRHSHKEKLEKTGSLRLRRFHTARDGRVIPVDITTNYFVYNGKGYICSIVRDISDRVQFEKEASFFRGLIEFTREPVYVLDRGDGYRMYYANPAACEHFGMSLEKLRTMRIPDWDPTFDMEKMPGINEQLKQGKLLRFETTHRVASGCLIPVEVTVNYLKFDGREFSGGNFHDIRVRKTMEASLRESECNLIEAQRIARVGNWARDLAGKLLYASPECRRIFGKAEREVQGTLDSLLELVHPEDRQSVAAVFASIVQTKQPFLIDFKVTRPDGTECIVRGRGELVADESGRPSKIIGTVQDITEQRKAESDRMELERQMLNIQKLESLGILAGGIAHDFNNLLTGILGNLSMMRMGLHVTHELNERITRCEKAVQQATGLTCQLLTFSRGGDPVKKLVDPRRIIRDASSFSLHGSNVAVKMNISDDLWPIEADEGQIGQVFHNLLINADQAMPQGGTVRVEASNCRIRKGESSSLQPGDYVQVSVIDQGTGITPENMDKIFDPYFTTKETGTGLGLTALHSIVRKHGGQVLVSSRVGAGSVFRVYLPALSDHVTGGNETEIAAPCSADKGEGFIMVMDDEETIRDLAQEMLSLLGYGVKTCSCGEELLEQYEYCLGNGKRPEAVVMDLTIPGKMGGLEAATAIQALDPEARLIVSSGYSNDPVMANYRRYGFCEAIVKPFRMDELEGSMQRALDGRPESELEGTRPKAPA